MAKVTIVIEDTINNGAEGISIGFDSDPDFPENPEDQTTSQMWAGQIIASVIDNLDDVEERDPDSSKH